MINSILKRNDWYYIDNPIYDVWYEILLQSNKNTMLCRRIISIHRIKK